MRNLKVNRKAIANLSIVLCLMILSAGSAQAQLTGFPGKIVCGFETGNVPTLNDPTPLVPPKPYENFKPGNYATVFNVLNLNATSQTVSFLLTLDNAGPFLLLAVTINPFASVDIGCEEILNPFFPPLVGQRIEGMLVPVAGNANFIVDTVYTFESQNAFERHVVYGEGVTAPTLGTAVDDILFDFQPPKGEFIQAASGAGGLGLGASIDVVRIDPVSIPPAMLDAADAEPNFEP